MATLFEYFSKDFNRILSTKAEWNTQSPDGEFQIIARIHQDFDSCTKFISFYIPEVKNIIKIIKSILLKIDDALKIDSGIDIRTKLPGEESMVLSELSFSGRIFIYADNIVDKNEFKQLKDSIFSRNIKIQLRDRIFSQERSKLEKPLAFISHDSRDKEIIAAKIASSLQNAMCPVWYDDYSLKIGDSLREKIEIGLKECKKCILIITPNFISNSGWTKEEFNSIFSRELLEKKNIILPIWHKVTKKDVFEYSPILSNRFALKWEAGEEKILKGLLRILLNE